MGDGFGRTEEWTCCQCDEPAPVQVERGIAKPRHFLCGYCEWEGYRLHGNIGHQRIVKIRYDHVKWLD